MKNLKTILGLFILIIIAFGAFLIIINPSNNKEVSQNITPLTPVTPIKNPVVTNPTPKPTPTPTPTPTVKSYPLSDVALHANAQSCWTAISGNVYNLTSFINQHPGGSRAITSLCGIDGTNGFLNQHEGQRRPLSELQNLFIGKLK